MDDYRRELIEERAVGDETMMRRLLLIVLTLATLETLIVKTWEATGSTCVWSLLAIGLSLHTVYAPQKLGVWLGTALTMILFVKVVSQGVSPTVSGLVFVGLGTGGYLWNFAYRNTRDRVAYSRFRVAGWLLLVGTSWLITGLSTP